MNTAQTTASKDIEIDRYEMGTAKFLLDKLIKHSWSQFQDPAGSCRPVQITVGDVIVLTPEAPRVNWSRQVAGSAPRSETWTPKTWGEILRAFKTLTTRELELDLGRVNKIYEAQGNHVEEVIIGLYDLLLNLVQERHKERGHSAQDSNMKIRAVFLRD